MRVHAREEPALLDAVDDRLDLGGHVAEGRGVHVERLDDGVHHARGGLLAAKVQPHGDSSEEDEEGEEEPDEDLDEI